MNASNKISRGVILAALCLILGLTGCATAKYSWLGSSEVLPLRWTDGALRIEVSMPSETLLENISVGSGFLLTNDIGVTCAHVLKGRAKDTPVTAHIAGQDHDLQMIGVNEKLDISVFRIIPSASTELLKKQSHKQPVIGQAVRVIGFPLSGVIADKIPSVTGGIVSGVERAVIFDGERIDGLLQLDAVTSDGNSGSPVTTLDGRIIGMVVFAASGLRAEWRGATFALPIKIVEEAAYDIIQNACQTADGQNKQMSGPTSVKSLINK